MNPIRYPELDETVYRTVLENGLTVLVVPRKGFTKPISLPITAPSIRILCWRERSGRLPPVWPTSWSIRCLICPASGISAPNSLPWVP